MAKHKPDVTFIDTYGLIAEIIHRLGEDPDREGMKDTPERFWKALMDLTVGLRSEQNVTDLLKVFNNTDGSREMVVVRDIEFTSLCEHHLLPFQGVAHVAYLPGDKIVGLSKFGRLVDHFAMRPQVQEKLTDQVAKAVWEATRGNVKEKPAPDTNLYSGGAACVVEARHTCMSCRGVKKQQASMVTSSLYGAFKDDPKTRAEFLSFVRK